MASTRRSRDDDISNNPEQASNFALDWMIIELQSLQPEIFNPHLAFNQNLDVFLRNFRSKAEAAAAAPVHDPLKFGGGLPATQFMFWNIVGSLSSSTFPTLSQMGRSRN